MMSVELIPGLDVSRETEARLRALEHLLAKWNPTINLVAKSTVASAWDRHILDSAQLFAVGPFDIWADLGSGGGFPGLVIAALAAEKHPSAKIVLVEIDQRKATFLREAARQLGIEVTVKVERIEELDPLGADVVSARALAPLTDLCAFAVRHLAKGGVAVFPKGAGWRDEVKAAKEGWSFDLNQVPSLTDPASVVLLVKEIKHV